MKIFVDIGSHIGETLLEVTKKKYAFDKIFCFEPSVYCIDELSKFAEQDNRIIICDFGLSNKNEKKAVYWHQRNDDDGYIDFKKVDTLQVSRLVRALTAPYPGAWANLKKKKVRIFKIEIPKFDLRGTPGRILFIQKQGPFVICRDRAVLIKDYKIESDRHMKLKSGQFLK